MRFVIFTHSLESDWNHGNAHFLRGIATELIRRGHELRIFEPRDGWSRRNLIESGGEQAIEDFRHAYPSLHSTLYHEDSLDFNAALSGADVALVHEWNSHELVRRVGEHHALHPGYKLFFHDTHHRAATDPGAVAAYDLRHYDGALCYGAVIGDLYRESGWARRCWTWHEAADTSVFRPLQGEKKEGDLVWIGNWGDGERAEELREYLIEPVRRLGLKARVYGVRYPLHAIAELEAAGIEYRGWLPNYLAPRVFARHRVTVHVPRRAYVSSLPGIPTIRPFEALACGIPLVSAPWEDREHLFRPGQDFLFARDGEQMTVQLRRVLEDSSLARDVTASGLATIRARHTCAHRVDELLAIARERTQSATSGGAD